MIGLAIARVDAISLQLTAALLVVSIILLLLCRSALFGDLLRPCRIIMFAILAGVLWGTAALFLDAYRVSVDESWLSGRQQIVASVEQVNVSTSSSRLRLTDIRRADGARIEGKVDVYLYGRDRSLTISAGEVIKASVKLHRPRNKLNPGTFDYRAYSFDQHIALIGSAKDVVILSSDFSLLQKARQRIVAALAVDSADDGSDDDSSGIIRALLLAERNYIPIHVQDSFSAAGVAHILAISGLHVGMVAGWGFVLIWWLMTRREAWIVRWPVRKVALAVGLLLAIGYATVAGWPITAQRSVVMMAAAILAWWLRSRSEPLNTMLATLILLLLFDPVAVVSISLWLSFFAATALLFWAGSIRAETLHEKHEVGGGIWRWASGLFWVSVVATLATLPIIADIFGRIPTYTLVANLLLVPLYSLYVLPISILAEIAAIFGMSSIAHWLFDIVAIGISYGNTLLHSIKTWPAGNLWIPDVPLYAGLLYGFGMMLSALFLLRRHYLPLLLCSTLSLLIYLMIAIPERDQDSTQLTVWDVGQGSAASVTTAGGRVMVVDVPGRYGSKFNGGTMVAAGLREQGLVHVDLLVLSHAQSDHAGGALRLSDHLRYIGEVWLADIPVNRNYPAMNEIITRVLNQGGAVRWLKKGDKLLFDDAKVEVLWPPEGFDPSNKNHASLVFSMRLSSGEKILFPGDIDKVSERKMVRSGLSQHNVMLVPHHGSRTSSSRTWIDALNPDIAIVQSGMGNRYGFPKEDVMQRYEQQGSQRFDSKYGAVMIRFDNGINIEQYRPENEGKRETALQWWQWAL